MHHIDIYLDIGQIFDQNQNSLGIGHTKSGISTKRAGGVSQNEEIRNILEKSNR